MTPESDAQSENDPFSRPDRFGGLLHNTRYCTPPTPRAPRRPLFPWPRRASVAARSGHPLPSIARGHVSDVRVDAHWLHPPTPAPLIPPTHTPARPHPHI